jgi:pimeloyl-ACP methyl ester carboxylesterase
VPEIAPMDHLVPIGLGHSMGAMITMVQQARHRTYVAVVNLGSTEAGLPEHLSEPASVDIELTTARSRLVDMARVQFGTLPARRNSPAPGDRDARFHADDVPLAVRAAFQSQQTNLLPTCALATLLPSFTDPERAAIAVPLFLGFGEHDLSPDPHGSVRRYRSASDVTLFVLPGSSHCHNQSGDRRHLWERVLAWSRSLPNNLEEAVMTKPQGIV